MSVGWQTKPLGELCKIDLGKTPARATAAFWDQKRVTNNVWLSIADLLNAEDGVVADSKEYLSDKGAAISKVVPKGTLLVSFKLTLGRLAFAGRDLFTNEAIAALTIHDERLLSKDFLRLALQFFDWGKAAENDVKLKGMTLNKEKLKLIQVPFPTLAEQKRLVRALDEAFDALAAARVNTEQNLRSADDLLRSHVQAVFTPAGEAWSEVTLDQISTNLDSKRVPVAKGERVGGQYPYYGASGIVDHVADYIFDGETLLISEDGANLLARSSPIAFSVSGKYWVNNHAHVLKFADRTTQRFVEFYLGAITLDEYVTGMAQPKLTQQALNSIPIPIPVNLDAQDRIVRAVEAASERTRTLGSVYRRKLVALDELMQSLLHQAFSGAL